MPPDVTPQAEPLATPAHSLHYLIINLAIERHKEGKEDIYAPEVAENIFGKATPAAVEQVAELLPDVLDDLKRNYGFNPVFPRTDLWFYGKDADGQPFRTTPPGSIKGFDALKSKFVPRGDERAMGLYFPTDGKENAVVRARMDRISRGMQTRLLNVREQQVDEAKRGFYSITTVREFNSRLRLANGLPREDHKLLGDGYADDAESTSPTK